MIDTILVPIRQRISVTYLLSVFFLVFTLVGQAQQSTIRGVIQRGDQKSMSAVSIVLSSPDDDKAPYNYITTEDGQFEFSGLIANTNYFVKLKRDGDYLNGVSTLDLVLIQKHILKSELLANGDVILSADVNLDERVTSADLAMLRQIILGIIREFPHGKSWRFVYDPSDDFDSNPFNELEEGVWIKTTNGVVEANFQGVKVGDVNYNSRPN